MNSILIIEDDKEVVQMISDLLGNKYRFTAAHTLSDAENIIKNGDPFDLIIMDFMLPDGKANTLCGKLKKEKETADIPIIFLTGLEGINDKIMAYTCGANDYLTKPFEIIELDLKIEARLKEVVKLKSKSQEIIVDDVLFNIEEQKLYLVGKENQKSLIDLTPIEAKLLYHLLINRNRIFSREQLMNKIWGESIHVIDRTIDKHISRIRKKISVTKITINSVHGTGYVLESKSS